MANIGLSQPYYAKYSCSQGTVSYSGLAKLGKATTVDLSLDNRDPEKLYADNGVAESLWLFSGATVTLGVDELSLSVAADILGLTAPASDKISFTSNAVAPYVGLGFIVKKVVGGTIKWRVVILYKCQFKPVDFSVNTQGETVEFQTPELEAAVLTPDDSTGKWQDWADYSSESTALAALQAALGGSTPAGTTE